MFVFNVVPFPLADHVKACEVTGQVRTDSVSRARSGSQPLVSLSTQSVVTSPPPPYQAAPLPMRPSIYQEDGTDVQEYLLLSECVTTVPSHDRLVLVCTG